MIDKPRNLGLPKNQVKQVPYQIESPKLELEPMSNDLKYDYLGDNKTLTVTISKVAYTQVRR